MSRFYFDTVDSSGRSPDDVGEIFQDGNAAIIEAFRALGDMARDQLIQRKLGDIRIEVRDERGNPVCRTSMTLSHEFFQSP